MRKLLRNVIEGRTILRIHRGLQKGGISFHDFIDFRQFGQINSCEGSV